jgi:ribose transport system ATP-binding protein
MNAMQQPVMTFDSIVKEFSGVRVLHGISGEIFPGEVLGILGENGAGKSTLLKIASGVYTPTSGRIEIEGEEVHINSPVDAKELGITMIPQEFNLVNSLNVFENIFLGNELKKHGMVDKPAMREWASKLLEELQSELSPDALIEDLSVADKQHVEIAKALIHKSRILIMDEPTTMLSKQEVTVLFEQVNRLRERGVAILFISHKLKEVKEICDRLMILRDGHRVSVDRVTDVNEHDMARKMVGRELSDIYPERVAASDESVLEVENLTVPGVIQDINFQLRGGEVLGFAGLVGAGRTELAETIIGIRKASTGSIKVRGVTKKINSPADAVDQHIAYISEDRQGKGLVMNFDIPQNITLISIRRYIRNLLIEKNKEQQQTAAYVEKFDIKAASLNTHLINLSGGNQQKVYLAKWMDTSPEILILDEPTRGIDINTKKEIYHFIRSLTDQGVSVIVISSEMDEIIGLCHRVIVMRNGSKSVELNGDDINEEEIMYYASGLKGESHAIH